MKKIPKIVFPEHCDTLIKKINCIGKAIDARYLKYHTKNAEVTVQEVQLGEYFLILEKVIKKDADRSKGFKYYLKKRFRYLTLPTVKKWMKLRRHVDLEEYPRLSYIPSEDLCELIDSLNVDNVGSFLEDYLEVNYVGSDLKSLVRLRQILNILLRHHYMGFSIGIYEDEAIYHYMELWDLIWDDYGNQLHWDERKERYQGGIDELQDPLHDISLNYYF